MNTFIFNKHYHLIINIIDDDNDDYEEEDTKDNVCQNDDNDNVDVNEHCEKNMSHHTQKKVENTKANELCGNAITSALYYSPN